MNQEYFNHSLLPKAYELQKQQKFGKDTLYQLFTCDKSFLHIVLHLYKSKFLVKTDLKRLWITIPITRHLWRNWKCTKHLPFWKLSRSNPNWQSQELIDDDRVDMRLANPLGSGIGNACVLVDHWHWYVIVDRDCVLGQSWHHRY
jgi:hypothetical protein